MYTSVLHESTNLLGRELGSKLTGRHLSHEVYPFSYREFLEFTRRQASAASLADHLRRGGFAGALRAGPGPGDVLLRELLRDVVHRDIVTRHSLRLAGPGAAALQLLVPAARHQPTPDLGRKLENAVLLSLRRRGASPAFAAAPHGWECDFVTEDLAIQCCARLTPENRERELRGLSQAADLPGRAGSRGRDLVIVTLDQQDSLTEDGRRIRVIPAWKWLD